VTLKTARQRNAINLIFSYYTTITYSSAQASNYYSLSSFLFLLRLR
jgi:hypothetical protein